MVRQFHKHIDFISGEFIDIFIYFKNVYIIYIYLVQ